MKYEDIQAQLDTLVAQQQDDRPGIVAYGMMNAGKSFLLNMLTQHVDKEFFKTNDIRETVEVARFETDDRIYLDTPGLDATDEDDRAAQRGVQAGDIVLFVHQAQGELEARELAFLGELRVALGGVAATNIVVVLSKIEKEAADKVAQIEARIAQQCGEVLGFAPRLFQVSAKRYREGTIKEQELLVAASGIEALAVHLGELAADVQAVRAVKRLVRIDALLEQVRAARAGLQDARAQKRREIKAGFAVHGDQVTQLRRFLEQSASTYKQIQG